MENLRPTHSAPTSSLPFDASEGETASIQADSGRLEQDQEAREQKSKAIKEILRRPSTTYRTAIKDEEKIFERISSRRYELENDAFEQDIKLKKSTLERLFIFLGGETIVIFIFALMQGLKLEHFALEEWSFKLLVAATITQITTMLLVAVKHLFPQKK